jgi:hypothetical protein
MIFSNTNSLQNKWRSGRKKCVKVSAGVKWRGVLEIIQLIDKRPRDLERQMCVKTWLILKPEVSVYFLGTS